MTAKPHAKGSDSLTARGSGAGTWSDDLPPELLG